MTLSLEKGYFTYGNGKTVFRDLNFHLPRGRTLSLLGPNGSGKTTLLKCLAGILSLTGGDLRLDGQLKNSTESRLGCFGYVPQISGHPAPYSVYNMVLMGRSRYYGTFSKPSEKDHAVAERALDRMGIASMGERPFSSLSGGEKQLVLIARALATESEILLFDEPTSALDLINQKKTIELLRKLAREDGLSVIFSSHDPTHALHLSDYSILMDGKESALSGEAEEIITEGNIERIFRIQTVIREIASSDGRKSRHVIPLLTGGVAFP